jgi:hypothetical protein
MVVVVCPHAVHRLRLGIRVGTRTVFRNEIRTRIWRTPHRDRLTPPFLLLLNVHIPQSQYILRCRPSYRTFCLASTPRAYNPLACMRKYHSKISPLGIQGIIILSLLRQRVKTKSSKLPQRIGNSRSSSLLETYCQCLPSNLEDLPLPPFLSLLTGIV